MSSSRPTTTAPGSQGGSPLMPLAAPDAFACALGDVAEGQELVMNKRDSGGPGMTETVSPHDLERGRFASYAKNHSHRLFRGAESQLYGAFDGWNTEHFGGRLRTPHIILDRPPARGLAWRPSWRRTASCTSSPTTT
jgi:hypothetical protein